MIRRVNHVSITVRDVDKVVAFFREAFGLARVWPAYEYRGEMIDRVTGFPGTHLKISKVEVEDVVLEFIQYLAPQGRDLGLRTNDVGCPHIGFTVDDIETMHRSLSAKGVRFKSAPQWNRDTSHPMFGWGIAYLWGPEDMTLELMQPPSKE
jgi:catechol 2,3-dioxygenase-like lactoylglutathione lyase family enzyme